MTRITVKKSIELKKKAQWVWKETLAIHRRAPETRLASSLSVIEIFVALYYVGVLKFNASNPFDENRDRCIISKGHGSICMYPILADLEFFPMEELQNVCQKALKFALEKKIIAGTGIDVYEDEPPKEIDFISLENLACSPNIGGNSEEGVLAIGRSAIGHLEDFFSP